MLPLHAYVLMVLSGSFYCELDVILKEKQFKNSKNLANTAFTGECEIQECLGKTFKFYEDGKILEDGFLTITTIFGDPNNALIDAKKKVLKSCVTKVNKMLMVVPKCSKFQKGMKLLDLCLYRKRENMKLIH